MFQKHGRFIVVMAIPIGMACVLAYKAYIDEPGSIRSRLEGKCVQNAAGGLGVVTSVDQKGRPLVTFKSGAREIYPEGEIRIVPCPIDG
jgi:hypothetical protein